MAKRQRTKRRTTVENILPRKLTSLLTNN